MPSYDFRTPRVYVDLTLASGVDVSMDAAQAHYLHNVLRLRADDPVLAFNGRDGEWLGRMVFDGRKGARLALAEQTRAQTPAGDLHYLFSPLKHARLDYLVQKAVEMGASRLQPVLTRHTQAARVNTGRMRANAIEAAEQCGILNVPEIAEPSPLTGLIERLDRYRLLVFCDEGAEVSDPLAALNGARAFVSERPPLAVLVGPEGGFAAEEREALLRAPRVLRLALGPRILRADTAAVAALALVQATLGDWR